jgi:hypothetical protein
MAAAAAAALLWLMSSIGHAWADEHDKAPPHPRLWFAFAFWS